MRSTLYRLHTNDRDYIVLSHEVTVRCEDMVPAVVEYDTLDDAMAAAWELWRDGRPAVMHRKLGERIDVTGIVAAARQQERRS